MLIDASIVVLGFQVFLILLTGGYTYTVFGVTLRAHDVTRPLLILATLLMVRPPFRDGRLTWDVFRSRKGLLLFSAFLTLYQANGRTLWSGDTVPTRYLPLSILREGNFDLDEFTFLHEEGNPYYLRVVGGRRVSDYPVGAALLVLPVYLPSAIGWVTLDSPFVIQLEKLAASTIVALSGVILYFILAELTSPRMALLITGVYAAGTSSLSVSSQALWQHGPSQLALTSGIYGLVRGRRDPRWLALAGFSLALAVIIRPTNLLLAFPLALHVLLEHRVRAVRFVVAGLPPVVFHLWYNATYFGDPLRTQWPVLESALWRTPFWDGLAGLLLSPGRGLFIYSPIFVFSLVSIALVWRHRREPLLRWLSAGALLTLFVYSRWMNWWGGWTYGPRLLADLAPVFALFLYPLRDHLRKSAVLRAFFALAIAWSVTAHAIGAFWDDGYWNKAHDVDRYPQKLWTWTDNQLVNPFKELFQRAVVVVRGDPTSQTMPRLLAASYEAGLSSTLSTHASKRITLKLWARNTGRALWLAWPRRSPGAVTLGWRWFREEKEIGRTPRGAPLHVDVAPGGSHYFLEFIPPPAEPGTYTLEIGLVAERVGWFADLGIPPIRVNVTVRGG